MSFAPIVMFVYNRSDHFTKTIDALSKCAEAKQSDFFVFSDGPKDDGQIEKVQAVRDVLCGLKNSTAFQNIQIIESTQNKGLAVSIITGVTEIIEKYGRAIVVEDDCMPSPHFLKYMNLCLDYYESDMSIGAIAGYIPKLNFPNNYEGDVLLAYRSCSWGWATWKNRWNDVDWELNRMVDFYKKPILIRKLNCNGNDRFIRLYRQTKGNGSSWSVRFGAHLVRNNQLTVYPRYSYIQNIGCDESGVHSKAEDAITMQVDLDRAIENPQLKELTVIPQIQKIMKKHYSAGIWSDFKRTIATIMIIIRENIKG